MELRIYLPELSIWDLPQEERPAAKVISKIYDKLPSAKRWKWPVIRIPLPRKPQYVVGGGMSLLYCKTVTLRKIKTINCRWGWQYEGFVIYK